MKKQSTEKKTEGYFPAFLESWKKVWEYKTLWFWGVVLALLGNNSFSAEKRKEPEKINWQDWSEDKIWAFLRQAGDWLGENWAQALLIFFLALLAFALFLILSAWVRGGLILFLAQKKKRKGWQENWREVRLAGKKSLRKLVFLDLFYAAIFLGLVIFSFVFLGGMAVWLFFLKNVLGQKILVGVFFLLSLVLIGLFLLLFLSKSLADFLVVILERRPGEALKESLLILKTKTKEFAKLILMFLLALWLAAWFLQIALLLLKAFFSGIEMVFNLPKDLTKNLVEMPTQNSSEQLTIFSLVALFVSGLFNLFKLEYKIWWLERNQIIKSRKEKNLAENPVLEVQPEKLEMVKATEETEIEAIK